jgi:hypothetical protein
MLVEITAPRDDLRDDARYGKRAVGGIHGLKV